MPKKPEPAELTERVIFPLSPELLRRIDDFRLKAEFQAEPRPCANC